MSAVGSAVGSARPPLPFGLGRDPSCSSSRCLQPDSASLPHLSPAPLLTPRHSQLHFPSLGLSCTTKLRAASRACSRRSTRPRCGTSACLRFSIGSKRTKQSMLGELLRLLGQHRGARADGSWARILTGLEQGRGPAEVGNDKNLEVGKGAITSVINAALEQDDEAWATSLREVSSSGPTLARDESRSTDRAFW